MNRLPEAGAQTTRANVDRLRALVSLENAEKLKGQGQITEQERKLLADAATILSNKWISPEQAMQELERLSVNLGGASSLVAQTIRVRNNATGQTGTIPANEFNSQEYTRI